MSYALMQERSRTHILIRSFVFVLLILGALVLPAHIVGICAIALVLMGQYEAIIAGVLLDTLSTHGMHLLGEGGFVFTSVLCIVAGVRLTVRVLREHTVRSNV